MPVSVWAITEELRHNLYDLVLAPIRNEAPQIKEVVISPLETCPPPTDPYVPSFSFIDKFHVPVVPGEPIVMFVIVIPVFLCFEMLTAFFFSKTGTVKMEPFFFVTPVASLTKSL